MPKYLTRFDKDTTLIADGAADSDAVAANAIDADAKVDASAAILASKLAVDLSNALNAPGASYKVAGGVTTLTGAVEAAASGLTTIISAIANLVDGPVPGGTKPCYVTPHINGTNIDLKSWQSDYTTAAADFTGAPTVSWIAIGT